jgi:hypothetical protein
MIEVVAEERRIYVVVADTVTVPTGIVKQPLGRQFAQGVHAAGAMRSSLGAKAIGKQFRDYLDSVANKRKRPVFTWSYKDVYERFTTIVLSARDSAEMVHVRDLLSKASIPIYGFWDSDNDEAYGKGVSVLTAFCTDPIEPSRLIGILDYLPLWGTPQHLALHTRPVS